MGMCAADVKLNATRFVETYQRLPEDERASSQFAVMCSMLKVLPPELQAPSDVASDAPRAPSAFFGGMALHTHASTSRLAVTLPWARPPKQRQDRIEYIS